MVKYVCNAFHALKITFTNEIADLCDALGADAQDVMRVFRQDKKLNIAPAYLKPGFAFGGSCLPKDVRALLCSGRIYDVSTPVLTAVVQSNKAQITRGVDAVLQTRKKKVGVIGLAFKSNTDDLRESPMVTLVETLIGKGCDVRIYDPNVVMARLKGANRSYIEQEIPHVSSLLCDTPECAGRARGVLVFGTAGQDASKVLAAARPDQVVVDLTRGAVHEMAPRSAESRTCVACDADSDRGRWRCCWLQRQPSGPQDRRSSIVPSSHRHASSAIDRRCADRTELDDRATVHRQLAALPKATVDVREPATHGRTIHVAAGESLQSALDAAQPGDRITLEAGATYEGPFQLRKKDGDAWIVIASNRLREPPGGQARQPVARAAHGEARRVVAIGHHQPIPARTTTGSPASRSRPRPGHFSTISSSSAATMRT